jgi:hypothetical protein
VFSNVWGWRNNNQQQQEQQQQQQQQQSSGNRNTTRGVRTAINHARHTLQDILPARRNYSINDRMAWPAASLHACYVSRLPPAALPCTILMLLLILLLLLYLYLLFLLAGCYA